MGIRCMLRLVYVITRKTVDAGGLLAGGPGVCVWSQDIVPILQGDTNPVNSFITGMGGSQGGNNDLFFASGADSCSTNQGIVPGLVPSKLFEA